MTCRRSLGTYLSVLVKEVTNTIRTCTQTPRLSILVVWDGCARKSNIDDGDDHGRRFKLSSFPGDSHQNNSGQNYRSDVHGFAVNAPETGVNRVASVLSCGCLQHSKHVLP